MRRTGIKRGSKPLERRTPLSQGDKPLERRTGLERGAELRRMAKEGASPEDLHAAMKSSALKRTRKPKRDEVEQKMMADWRKPVDAPTACCAVCRRKATPKGEYVQPEDFVKLEGHHVIEQEVLRRIAKDRGIAPMLLLWDPRNRLILCELCHVRHTRRIKKVPMRVLLVENLCFASDLGLEWYIEHNYPLAGRIGL